MNFDKEIKHIKHTSKNKRNIYYLTIRLQVANSE